MTSPRVSIVVPTRSRPEALRACVAALLRQDAPPGGCEIIVVDDGDGLPALPPEVRVVSGDRTGPAAARNRGAEAARGALLAFIDDDCIAAPGWVRELEAALARNPRAGAAGVTVNGLPGNRYAVASQMVLDAAHAHLAVGGRPGFAASCNLALPADAFRELGGFDPAFRFAEDRDLCTRWCESGRSLVWAPAAQVVHRREMGLSSFLGQHAGYGRGAFALHRRVAGAGLVPAAQPGFYRTLHAQVRRAPRHRGRVTALAALTQVVAATGFALEAIATRYGIGRRACAEPADPMPGEGS